MFNQTYISKSDIHGYGVFVTEDIAAHTEITLNYM